MPSPRQDPSGPARPDVLAGDSSPAENAPGPPSRDRSAGERRLQEADELAVGALPGSAVRPYRELLELEPEHVEARLHLARLLDRLAGAGRPPWVTARAV